MVEGPLVHRVAEVHRLLLVGKAFGATSPSGRFVEGASAINGRFVSHIEAHGKNIFYFFTRQKLEKAMLANLPEDVVVIHIHFGMSGSFRTFVYPGPEPREKTRLRLESEDGKVEAHLSASKCLHGDMEMYREKIARLGPDPLRSDADKETVWRKMQLTRKTIGSILMDQSVIAGIGNMYRAEILFLTGLHPDQRASSLSYPTLEKLWSHSVQLFRLGMVTGSTITVSPGEAGKPYPELRSAGRFYVYSQSICKLCGGAVRTWPSAGRTIYACEACQPLQANDDKGLNKTLDEDAFTDRSQAFKPQGGLLSVKETSDIPVTNIPGKSISFAKHKKKASSTTRFRETIGGDERIVEHQPLDTKSGPVNFSSSLADLKGPRFNLRALEKGSLKNSPGWRAAFPRKYHSGASEYGVIHEKTLSCLWPTVPAPYFPTRRVTCITMPILRTRNPRAKIGLQALRTLCLGSPLTELMWSGRVSSSLPLLRV